MFGVNVKGEVADAQARARLLKEEMAGANARSVNRTLTTVRAQAVREVAPSYPEMKASELKARMKYVNARRNNPVGSIVFSGGRIQMYGRFGMRTNGRFGVRFTKMPWRVEDLEGNVIRPETLTRAFRNRLRGGRAAVLVRTGKGRHPISVLVAPGVSKAVVKEAIERNLAATARSRFREALDQEVRFLLIKRAG